MGVDTTPSDRIVQGRWSSHVHEAGSGTDETVVFLHGSGPGAGALSNWRFALPASATTRRSVALDFVGFGRSEHPEDPPGDGREWMDAWTEQVLEVMDQLEIERAHLVGNSMGGAVGLHLLDRRPERFEKVVLMGAAGVPFELTPDLDAGWGFYDDPSAERMESLLRAFVYDVDIIGDDIAQIAAERREAAMDERVRRSFEAMFPAPRQQHIDAIALAPEALAAIPHDTLLIHGAADQIVPAATSLHLLEHLPKAQLHLFGDCRHWVQIERRDAFHTLVFAFLDGEL